MWEPYFADVSELVREGRNKLELTLINNLRNMQGPLHLTEGESYYVCPPSFIKEKCIWYDGNEKNKTACREFESLYPCHVGTSFTCSDFLFHKKSVTRSTVPPFSQKGNAFSGALYDVLSYFYFVRLALIHSISHLFGRQCRQQRRPICHLFITDLISESISH